MNHPFINSYLVALMLPACLMAWSATPAYSQVNVVQGADTLKPLELIPSLDESEVRSLIELDFWNPNSAVIQKMLLRLPLIDAYTYDRMEKLPSDVLNKRLASRTFPRLERYRISGKVKSIQQHLLTSQAADLYEFKSYWIVDIETTDIEATVRLCVRSVPKNWLQDGQPMPMVVGQRVSLDGLMVYAFADDETDHLIAVFVAPRICWFPQKLADGASPGQLLLAKNGVDIGSFDTVAQSTNRNLGKQDAETFFQVLSAVSNLDRARLEETAVEPIDVAKIFTEPHGHYGSLMKIRGRLRRITPVDVDMEKYGNRYGVAKYYQLDIFVPIDRNLRIVSSSGESLTFEDDFPISVCVTSLPESLANEKRPSEDVEVTGFFFKLWTYHSASSRRKGSQLQTGPLLIGSQPEIVVPPSENEIEWLIGTIFGLMTLSILIVGGYLLISKRRGARSDGEPRAEISPKIDLPGSND